jgi:Flp pilus assembly protein TadD
MIDAETHYRQAVEAAEIGQWDAALDALGQTVQANGAHQGALVGRGVLRARQGHIKDAAADLTQAIDLGLRSADTHTYRGVLWARQGEAALAIQDWTTASLLSPNFPLPRYNRGMLSWMQGEPEKATADFEAACNLGFGPACMALRDLETRRSCCPPGGSSPAARR